MQETYLRSLPDAPATPTKPRTSGPWLWIAVALAIALVAAMVFGLVEVNAVASAREREQGAIARTNDVRAELGEVRETLDTTRAQLDSVGERAADQERRLTSCDKAISIGVKMDGVLQDLVDNALYYGSLNEWNHLWNRYDVLGRQWSSAANGCVGGSAGDFTFA